MGRIASGTFARVWADPDDADYCFRESREVAGEGLRWEDITDVAVWRAMYPERPADLVRPGSTRLPRVPGESIRQIRRGHAFEFQNVSMIARTAFADLAYLHAAGWYHGDISTGNIVVSGSHARLVDFAGAIPLRNLGAASFPATYSPAFAAPELVQSARRCPANDVWALAAVLYTVVTGEGMVSSGDFSPTRVAACHAAFQAATERVCGGKRLHECFVACTDMNPDRRPTAAKMAEFLGHGPVPRIPSPPKMPVATSAVKALEKRMPPLTDLAARRLRRRYLLTGGPRRDLAELHAAFLYLTGSRDGAPSRAVWDVLEWLDFDIWGVA